jgi:DNA-binding Lrp family transcriptional regulator
MSKTKTPNTKQAILEVLKVEPQATVAQIAVSAAVGRSTAGKMLAQLESDGQVRRTEGGRDGNRRLPDLWSLAGEQPAANDTGTKPASSAAKATDGAAGTGEPDGGKLKPGGLEPLVLGYLEKHADSGPHGPTVIAKALQRSSGAVGNCLERLTEAKKVKLVVDKPRRYSLAA